MSVTAAQIKELREKSGAGMMDCKKALSETSGNVEEAMDWLRKKGLAAAAKKSGRTAAEGLVGIASSGSVAALVEVNSETDFVAKNEQFQELVKNIAGIALENGSDIEALKASAYPDADNVEDAVTKAIATIGENMNLRRAARLEVSQGIIATYIHNAAAENLGKIGVLVALESSGNAEKLAQIGKQIAMHVAASKPEALDRDSVDPEIIERERNVLIEQAVASGKPQEIAEKMVEGRIRKFYEQICLLDQAFVIDGKTPVREFLKEQEKEVGAEIKISAYENFVLGEGIEKEESNFAEEVAAAANG